MMQQDKRVGVFDKMGWKGLANMDFSHWKLLRIQQGFYVSDLLIFHAQ
jgi:hypothetical protein